MKIESSEISMIFQEPMTALNPTMKIGEQLLKYSDLRKHRQQRNFI